MVCVAKLNVLLVEKSTIHPPYRSSFGYYFASSRLFIFVLCLSLLILLVLMFTNTKTAVRGFRPS